jgi:hypothetical protein
MTSPRTVDEAYKAWRMEHPDLTGSAPFPLAGYRRCSVKGCPTLIEDSRKRRRCFFHGGKPGPEINNL